MLIPFYYSNLLPSKPQLSFRHLKQSDQGFDKQCRCSFNTFIILISQNRNLAAWNHSKENSFRNREQNKLHRYSDTSKSKLLT